jgi:hypothetical protein
MRWGGRAVAVAAMVGYEAWPFEEPGTGMFTDTVLKKRELTPPPQEFMGEQQIYVMLWALATWRLLYIKLSPRGNARRYG